MDITEAMGSLGKLSEQQKNAVDLQRQMVESYHLTIGQGNATISTQIIRGSPLKEKEEIVAEIKQILTLL